MAARQDRAVAVAAHSTTEDLITFIIPVLNDRQALEKLLPQLQPIRDKGHEVLLVDGGSSDGSVPAARPLVDRILMTGIGRGRQMNLGAENASHEILNFLHADTQLPADYAEHIQSALADQNRHWGRFNVRLDEPGFLYALIAAMMNLRSRLSGVATGDQGIFVRRLMFHQVGGFEAIPLMEDIALSKALRKKSWPVCLRKKITVSARRWKQHGMFRTILLMWFLRLAYFIGAKPERLVPLYYPPASPEPPAQEVDTTSEFIRKGERD